MQHTDLANGKWQSLSLIEQLANIGSEVGRAAKWQGRDEDSFKSAYFRAFELLDLTIQDPRWAARLKEIVRARELLASAIFPDNIYTTSLSDLERYFFQFALAARAQR